MGPFPIFSSSGNLPSPGDSENPTGGSLFFGLLFYGSVFIVCVKIVDYSSGRLIHICESLNELLKRLAQQGHQKNGKLSAVLFKGLALIMAPATGSKFLLTQAYRTFGIPAFRLLRLTIRLLRFFIFVTITLKGSLISGWIFFKKFYFAVLPLMASFFHGISQIVQPVALGRGADVFVIQLMKWLFCILVGRWVDYWVEKKIYI